MPEQRCGCPAQQVAGREAALRCAALRCGGAAAARRADTDLGARPQSTSAAGSLMLPRPVLTPGDPVSPGLRRSSRQGEAGRGAEAAAGQRAQLRCCSCTSLGWSEVRLAPAFPCAAQLTGRGSISLQCPTQPRFPLKKTPRGLPWSPASPGVLLLSSAPGCAPLSVGDKRHGAVAHSVGAR